MAGNRATDHRRHPSEMSSGSLSLSRVRLSHGLTVRVCVVETKRGRKWKRRKKGEGIACWNRGGAAVCGRGEGREEKEKKMERRSCCAGNEGEERRRKRKKEIKKRVCVCGGQRNKNRNDGKDLS